MNWKKLAEGLTFIVALSHMACSSNEQIVTEVISGDTVRLGSKKIQLLGVSAPIVGGLNQINQKEQCYGEESRKFLEVLIKDTSVNLSYDNEGTPLENEKGDIKTMYVYYGNTLINNEMIKNGFAFVNASTSFSKLAEFQENQRYAQSMRLGVWGTCKIQCNGAACVSEAK